MFTGLVERTGKVIAFMPLDDGAGTSINRLIVDPGAHRYKTELGDSVAVNGCCLTVVKNDLGMLSFDLSKETMEKTTFFALATDDEVNLERALALGDRLGGHLVSGHIDCTGTIASVTKSDDGWVVRLEIPRAFGRYVIHKGSITVDGVSLTVNHLEDVADKTLVSVTLIPKTVESTTFYGLLPSRVVNIEVDMIGKYIERLQVPFT